MGLKKYREKRKEYRQAKRLFRKITLFGSIVGVSVLIYSFLTSYGIAKTEELLKSTVERQTDRKYSIEFKAIDISLWEREVFLYHIKLAPTIFGRDTTQQQYEIEVPKLTIRLASLLSVYLDRELSIESVKIFDPSVRLISPGKNNKLSQETGKTYNILRDYLQKFSIDSLDVRNGSLTYQSIHPDNPLNMFLSDLDFSINNLLVDSEKDNNKLLFLDDIELTLTDQELLLADSVHRVSIGLLQVSTQHLMIKMDDITLLPRTHIDPDQASTPNRYNVSVPTLSLEGIDFQKAYTRDELALNSLTISKPRIRLHQETRSLKKRERPLSELIFGLFGKISVGQFRLDEAFFSMDNIDGQPIFAVDNASISIDSFRIDSTNYHFDKPEEYFKDFSLSLDDVAMALPDSLHMLRMKQLRLTTQESLFVVDSLTLTPDHKDSLYISLSLPKISLREFDIIQLLSLHKLSANHAELETPTVDVTLLQPEDPSQQKVPWLKEVRIANTSIKEGSIKTNIKGNVFQSENITISVEDLHIEPGNKDHKPIDYGVLQQIKFDNTQFKNDTIGLSIAYSNSLNNFEDFILHHVQYTSSTSPFPLTIEEIHLSGFDIEAFDKRNLFRFDSLSIIQPVISIVAKDNTGDHSKILTKLSHHTEFEKVLLKQAQLSLYKNGKRHSHLDNVNLELSHFRYDTLQDELHTGIAMKIDSFHLDLPQIGHELYAHSMKISQSDSTLDVSRLVVRHTYVDSYTNTFDIRTDELELTHLDLHRLINEQVLIFKNGHLTSPTIDLHIRDTTEREKTPAQKDLLDFSLFRITNGNLSLHHHSGLYAKTKHLTLSIEDFDLSQNDHLFHAADYHVLTGKTMFHHPAMQDTATANNLYAHLAAGDIWFANLKYNDGKQYNLNIPELKIKGFAPETLAKDGKIQLKGLSLKNAKLGVGIDTATSKNNGHYLPDVSIQEFLVDNMNMAVYRPGLNRDDSIFIRNYGMEVLGFHIDSTMQFSHPGQYFENLKIKGSGLKYTMEDSMYYLAVDQYEYNYANGNLLLEGFAMIPTYDKEEFSSLLTYQKDWLNGTTRSIRFTGLDVDAFTQSDFLKAQRLDINGLFLDTHRDKRIPADPELIHKELPVKALKKLPFKLALDTIAISDATVWHSEYSDAGDKPGLLTFSRINAGLYNAKNTDIAQGEEMVFLANGQLQDTAAFQINSRYMLSDTTGLFTFSGTLSAMDLTVFNRYLEPTAFVQIKDGSSKRTEFTFEADDHYAVGEMTFYYDDLKISILNHDNTTHQSLGASIKSFFANTFVVNTRNPRFLFVRDGDIYHERNVNKSVFNYWAKALLSGVISSIGAKNNKKEIKAQNKKNRTDK